jgi:Family of unknown function (DUF6325)
MEDNQRELGPIDVVVIGYPPGAPATGDSIALFLDLVDRGIIRVFDVRFVKKNYDGTFVGLDPGDLDVRTAGDLAAFDGASTGLLSDDDVALAAAQIEPGSSAVMIVYENRWAGPFIAAVRRNGGELITFERIGVPDLIAALDALDAEPNRKA